jgi:SPP1 family holin
MKISKGTIIRTILIAIVIINRLLEINGKSIINVSESEIAMLLEYVLEIGIIVAGFWYNNSFTEKAKKAQTFLEELKKGE